MPRKKDEQGENPTVTEDVEVTTQEVADEVEVTTKAEPAPAPATKVQMVEPKGTTVRVKFLEDHVMSIALNDLNFKKGDVTTVETHIANLLVSRKIAHIV